MKQRWLGPFPIAQVNYQCNNYILDVSSNPDLRQIYKTFHIRLLKPTPANNQHEFLQCDLSEPGPVKNDRHEVEK